MKDTNRQFLVAAMLTGLKMAGRLTWLLRDSSWNNFLIGEQTGDETSIKEKAKVRSSLLGKKTKQCMCSRHSWRQVQSSPFLSLEGKSTRSCAYGFVGDRFQSTSRSALLADETCLGGSTLSLTCTAGWTTAGRERELGNRAERSGIHKPLIRTPQLSGWSCLNWCVHFKD